MHIDLNDMYIEDSSAMFDQLEGGFSDEQIEEASLGATDVGAEDLFEEEGEFSFEDEDGEVEFQEDYEEEESEEESEEEEYEESESEEEEEEVDFEEYEVNLPNGEVIKLHEAINGYKAAQELEEERAAFEAEKANFQSDNQSVKRVLSLAKLEAERVIEDYKEFDWAELSRTDPQAYVENREFLDKYKARHREILAEMDFVEEQLETEKAEANRVKAAQANEVLTRDIPGWNKDMYVGLMTYAVKELGMDQDFVVNSVDAGFFKSLHKAQQLDQGKQTVKAKIKKLGGSPKKVVKAAPKVNKTVNGKKATIKRKIESGQAGDMDLADAFDFLED